MKSISAFFKLIRWPNLVFIALTQILFYYFLLPFVYRTAPGNTNHTRLTPYLFYLLMAASVFIAAAGYIINDYYDIKIDSINKSGRVIVGSLIQKRTAVFWYVALSLGGLLLSAYIGWRLQNPAIPLLNLLVVLLLLFYSTTLKRKLLIGNILISALTAWVILVFPVAENRPDIPASLWHTLLRFSLLYGVFAFIISLIREIVKDLEDMKGDALHGCTTMPLVWGEPAAKLFAIVFLLILLVLIVIVQFAIHYWFVALYTLVLLIIPVFIALKKLNAANSPKQYHQVSTFLKLIMLVGILSILFFNLF